MQASGRDRFLRILAGAATGFLVGIMAGVPLGVLGFCIPFVGMVLGAIFAGTVSPRICQWFLGGYLIGDVVTTLFAALLLSRMHHGMMPYADRPSELLFFAAIIGNGGALIGGLIGAALAEPILQRPVRPFSYALVLLSVPLIAFALLFIFFGISIADSDYQAKVEHLSAHKAAVEEEKRSHEEKKQRLDREQQKREQAGERILPTLQAGPFIYPNRLTAWSDPFQILLITNDSPETVARYYAETLSAKMTEGRDSSTSAPFWEGDFLYQGNWLHIRTMLKPVKVRGQIIRSETSIILTSARAQ